MALFACAFNLLLGYVGLLSFGHAAFFGGAAYITAHTVKVWGLPPELGILAGVAVGGGARRRVRLAGDPPPGHLFRDDHAGACADGRISSRCRRRSPAARTASRRCRAGICFGVIDLNNTLTMYYFVLAMFLFGFGLIVPHDQLAVRPGHQGDPRERAARDLARLPRRALQAAGLHPVGGAGRAGRIDQGAGVPVRLADRCRLDDVGRGRADDAARRARHDPRARWSAPS